MLEALASYSTELSCCCCLLLSRKPEKAYLAPVNICLSEHRALEFPRSWKPAVYRSSNSNQILGLHAAHLSQNAIIILSPKCRVWTRTKLVNFELGGPGLQSHNPHRSVTAQPTPGQILRVPSGASAKSTCLSISQPLLAGKLTRMAISPACSRGIEHVQRANLKIPISIVFGTKHFKNN